MSVQTVSLIIGMQGAGKSTQSRLLEDRQDVKWLSTGEIFRTINDPEVNSLLNSGILVPDEKTCDLVGQALNRSNDSFVLLDGIPRNTTQSLWLIDFINSSEKFEFGCILSLEISRETAIKRMLDRGRDDDTPEAIDRRIKGFAKVKDAVKVVTDEYQAEMIVVDAEPDVETVHNAIVARLKLDG